MRRFPIALLLTLACTTTTTTTAPQPEPAPADHGGAYGLTIKEEAEILALEDRRQYDEAIVTRWVTHPNPLHRIRMALALGRIGAHNFIDLEGDDRLDSNERRAGVKELIELTRDADPKVRETAVFALGEIGDPSALTVLYYVTADESAPVAAEAVEAISKFQPIELAHGRARYVWMTKPDVREGVRARALRYLFRLDSDEAMTAAVDALGDPSPIMRQEAAYSLSRRAIAAARPQLELLRNDPNPLTRAYAITALGRIGAAESMPVLLEALGDLHPWVRTNAAVAIGRVATKNPQALRPDDLPRIFAALEDPDPGVRASAISTLGHYAVANETARARLREILQSGSQWDRDLAAIAFFEHLDAHTRRDIAQTKRREHEQHDLYRTELLTQISTWGLARVIEAAKSLRFARNYQSHEAPSVRAAVLSSIGEDALQSQARRLRQALESDPDVIVRAAAIEQYAKLTRVDPKVWYATLRAAEERERTSEMNDARLAAINAIAEWEQPERAPYLLELTKDPDPVVRRTAAYLFEKKERTELPQYAPLPVGRTQAEYEEIVRWSREPHTATIHMPRGKIELALLAQDAPMTAWNFAQLAQRKYFDDTSFMRVVPNFVIQGGDPRNDQNGGPGYAIRDEINQQRYTRGAVGMALSGPDTGGSQFFITHSPQPHLDGGYTIFGRVYDGMSSVVDQVERGDRVTTITIDEHPPVGQKEIDSVPNVSLPLRIGPMTAQELAIIPGYDESKSAYAPDSSVLEMFPMYVQPGDRIEVYMGTWCHDSQREVPKLLRVLSDLESAGTAIPTKFIALDRSKQKPAALIEGRTITKVATFIYYRGDQELGRIEERPEGLFEDALLAIAAKAAP
jgi:cyclophilin family peptidyl-prolyl cis-trans isomerase/HEAT repeat protein